MPKWTSYAIEDEEDEEEDSFLQLNLSRPLLRACEALRSGKTAAFALPTLERLLFRPKRMRAARVQEVDSSSMPDIVVATPGCMIDHLRNARADYVVFSDND